MRRGSLWRSQTVTLASSPAGQEALIPAAWDRPMAAGPRYCVGTAGTTLASALEALPGVCEGKDKTLMLSVQNTSSETVTVDRGFPLAFNPGTLDERELADYVAALPNSTN